MKKIALLAMSLFAAMLFVNSCKNKSTGQSEKEPEDSICTELLVPSDSDFFMLRDEKLPQSIDLKQDISQLGYQNLRLLRSYVYALHGHWFMEADLNTFFRHHTEWYDDLCEKTWGAWNYDELTIQEQAHVDDYETLLWEDYPEAYKMIMLTPEEKAFVAKIDARMAELMKQKYVRGEDDLTLLNPSLMVNMHRIFHPDPTLLTRLSLCNFAIEPTQYQQLFNVYENNEYDAVPNFVTTDVMLQAYHMYFSYILKSLEGSVMLTNLRDALWELLSASITHLEICNEQILAMDQSIAVYYTVALKLLGEDPYAMVDEMGANLHRLLGEADKLVTQELALTQGLEDNFSPLFQTETYFNYSLFKPRGHYSRKPSSQQYFRAMMWLQKGCFFRENEQQLEHAIRMAQRLNEVPSAKKKLESIDLCLRYLMGKPDNVSLLALADHLSGNEEEIFSIDPDFKEINQWLIGEFKKCNRISPKQKNGPQDQLNLLPQRYMLDSEILGHMYDPKKNASRAYPTGLDVMSLLGVNEATNLVNNLNKEQPWSGYEKERKLVQDRAKEYLTSAEKTMYDEWMHSLVTLQKEDKQQPNFMHTKSWKIKNLNSALASWALLKHDALLYAEQPMGAECGGGGLPDPICPGYVEPNVAFWKEMLRMVNHSQEMLDHCFSNEANLDNQSALTDLREKGEGLMNMVKLCLRCSEAELAGKKLDNEDYRSIEHIGSHLEWYTLSVIDPDLEYADWSDIQGSDRCIAQVADVFTRNIANCPKDGILYEATGLANAMYVVVEIEGQLFLTRGATYSYYEFVRPLGDRLSDEQWQDMLFKGKAPTVPQWFAPLLIGNTVDVDERFVYSTGC